MPYITSTEYATLTGKSAAEATTIRLTVASKLLDSRIGAYVIDADGWKISDWTVDEGITTLPTGQIAAVKNWVASMVSYLYDNGDTPPSGETVSLGRFSTKGSNPKGATAINVVPACMGYVDMILVTSGIIRRGINVV